MTRDSAVKTYMKIIVIVLIIIVIANLIYRKTRFYYYRPFFIPFNQRLNSHDLILTSGETFTLRVMNVNKRVTYKSSDFKVVFVLFNGKIYARNVGTAVVYASFEDKQTQCHIRVIDLNYDEIEVQIGGKKQLKVRGATKTPEWISYNKRVATVDGDGIVTGEREGTAVIGAKVHGKLLRCKVQVKNEKQDINK